MAGFFAAAFTMLIVLKPTAIWPGLEGLPIVHVAFALVLLGAAVDVLRGRLSPRLPAASWLVAALFAWGLATTALKAPSQLGAELGSLGILASVYVAVVLASSTPGGLRAFAAAYVLCAVVVTAVALVQSTGEPRCFDLEPDGSLVESAALDGRACTTGLECEAWAPLPHDMRCERPGPLGTTTIGQRARFRGALADPNELAVMTVSSLPFVLVLAERARRRGERRTTKRPLSLPVLLRDRGVDRAMGLVRAIPATAMFTAVAAVVVLTKSRTGVIVYLVVAALELTRRFGPWAVVGGCFVGPPVLLLGGRDSQEASDSSDERMHLLVDALEMVKRTRGVGVGLGRFVDESDIGLTAHNAYVLAAAEAGLVGMVLFGLVVYASMKAAASTWLDADADPDARRFAPAITTSLAGACVGSFFLSWTWKDVLYVLLGAAAALEVAAGKRTRPSAREALLVALAMAVLLGAVAVVARFSR
jgi:hypothetical protein